VARPVARLARFTAAVGDIKELRVAQVIVRDEMLAPHLFPPRADGTTLASVRSASGRLSLKLGKFGVWLHQLSRMPLHRQFAAGNGAGGDGGMRKLGKTP
jgi:hypothetical protein